MALLKSFPSDLKVFKQGCTFKDPISNRSIDFIVGVGAPGNAPNTISAPIGSLFVDYVGKRFYFKQDSGQWTNKWDHFPTMAEVDNLILGGISWREPVALRSAVFFADITAAQNALNAPPLVDNHIVVAGDRILFSNLGTGSNNVYILSGSAGAWVLTEDINALTVGDTLYVKVGTLHGGETLTYNGTLWVLTSQTSLNELNAIRAFMGKDGIGNETPGYSSENVIANGDNLETAIGKLDSSAPVISTASNVTSTIVLDSVLTNSSEIAKWVVSAKEVGQPLNRSSLEILAVHNRLSVVDATQIEHNISGIISLGSPISGLTFAVTLSGTGALQTMSLESSSSVPVNLKAIRLTV